MRFWRVTLPLLLAFVCGCKEAAVGTATGTPGGPTVTRLSPIGARPGSGPLTLSVFGSGFSSNSTVQLNGQGVPTVHISPSQLNAQVPANNTATATTLSVTVLDSQSGVSAPAPFIVGTLHVLPANFMFNPKELTISPGMDVDFHNGENMLHSVSKDVTAKPGPDKPALNPGETYVFTVPADIPPGTDIFFHCNFHGAPGDGTKIGNGMAGVLHVR